MATYDRSILVPYLYDVCCIEMLCSRLNNRIISKTNQLNQWIASHQLPQKPHYPQFDEYRVRKGSEEGGFYTGCVFLGLGLLFILMDSFIIRLLGVAGCGIGLLLAFVMGLELHDDKILQKQNYTKAIATYERLLKQYEQDTALYPKAQKVAEAFQSDLNMEKQRLGDAKKMRDSLYSVNIIPRKYRNLHTAYYLYDYFTSTRETDLDKIIQTLLLDEIIKRLDKIIHQNEEILINQRIQIAMQEKANKQIEEAHNQEMKAIARCEHNLEIQNDYLHMIETHQRFNTFLLASEYLYRRK